MMMFLYFMAGAELAYNELKTDAQVVKLRLAMVFQTRSKMLQSFSRCAPPIRVFRPSR